jgi:DNA repair ATPase RecN
LSGSIVDRIGEYIMAKHGIENLALTISDSIIDFVREAVSNELDKLELDDKAQEAVDDVIQRTDLSEQLMEAVDIDSSFQDWLDSKYEIEPALDSIRQDVDSLRIDSRALIESLESRLMALESVQNDRKSLTWTNTLVRLWGDFRALFVTVKP